jgi:hypothetical protein
MISAVRRKCSAIASVAAAVSRAIVASKILWCSADHLVIPLAVCRETTIDTRGYTRDAATRPNKQPTDRKRSQHFQRENTRIGARMRLVTGQPPGFTATRFPKVGRTGNFRPAER